MRRLLLTAIIALTGGSGMASSIEYISGVQTSNGSFVRHDCSGCQPLKGKAVAQGYAIPSIEPGTQHMEMRDVDGKRTLMRTEAWLGGAPVTFVSTNPALMPADASSTAIATYDNAEPLAHPEETASTPAGIDVTTTTAAVKAISVENAAAPVSASAIAAPAFPDFQLRGN